MHKYVSHIRAALPYEPPGMETRYLKIDLDLDKLTILVGPNASGKTAILESIGYLISGLLETAYCALGLSLTIMLRPRGFMFSSTEFIPSPIGGVVTLDNSHVVSNLYIELTYPLLLKTDHVLKEMIHSIMNTKANILLQEIEKDLSNNIDNISRLEEILGSYSILSFIRRKEEIYTILDKLVTNIIGQDISAAVSYLLPSRSPRKSLIFETQREAIRHVLLYRPVSVKVMYSLADKSSLVNKTFIIESKRGIVVVKKRHTETTGYPRIAVFHPGFIYQQGVFESLYYAYIRDGLSNEKESIRILREYIKWIDGYELIERTLHIRTVDGKRVSVYCLSDGYRVAIFMGLLYAISRPPVLFLIDTPETFVHPDGLPIITDLIARLVAEGNQVIIATQSIEFLEELLVKAKQYGIIDYTSVQRVELSKEGIVKVKGRWSGEVGLESIRELGADLRR